MKTNLDVSLNHKMVRLGSAIKDPAILRVFEMAYRLGYRAGVQYGSFVQGEAGKLLANPAGISGRQLDLAEHFQVIAEDLGYPRYQSIASALKIVRLLKLSEDNQEEDGGWEEMEDLEDELLRPRDTDLVAEIL